MLRLWSFLRHFLKRYFDNIPNDKLKKNILQAVPFWIGSIITGIFAVFYAKLFTWAEELLFFILDWKAWLVFLLTPTAFLLSWWIVKRFAPYAKGSGIPQVMASVELANPKENSKIKKLLSWRIMIVKVFSSMVMVMGGGAVGREGPTIQIAGSVFRKVYEYLPAWWPKISKKNMILTGAAAGLSAAFNTPLGGIVFAVEELAKIHINYFKTALFTAIIIAGLTAQTLAGSYLYLGYPKTHGVGLSVMISIIFVSGISGILASKLSVFMLQINEFKKRKLKTDNQRVLFLIVSGLIIASLAFFVHREILGSGKELLERLLFSEDKHQAWYIPIFRMIGPALAFTSGGAGGVFAPALSAGASIGALIAEWGNLSQNATNVVILAGMVAFLTGITRAPFTSAILVLEMTDRHSLIFHLMLAAMVSSLVSMFISKHSLYDMLKQQDLSEIRRRR